MFLSIQPTNPNRILKLMTGLLLVCVLGVAIPNESFACHKNNKQHGPNGESCDGSGGGKDKDTPQVIGVHEDFDLVGDPAAPLWAPTDHVNTCVLQKSPGKSLSGAFPRHDLCASLPEDSVNAILRDDIVIIVHTTNRGVVLGVEVQGQDYIGSVGLVHISNVMVPYSVENKPDGSIVIHVHADDVGLYQCDTHVLKNNSICEIQAGVFALHDLVYSP